MTTARAASVCSYCLWTCLETPQTKLPSRSNILTGEPGAEQSHPTVSTPVYAGLHTEKCLTMASTPPTTPTKASFPPNTPTKTSVDQLRDQLVALRLEAPPAAPVLSPLDRPITLERLAEHRE